MDLDVEINTNKQNLVCLGKITSTCNEQDLSNI